MPLDAKPPHASGLLSASAPPHWRASNLAAIPHGYFGRRGGVSTAIHASLNAGTGSKDDPAATTENRRRIAAAFGFAPAQLVGVHQVHSPIVHVIDAPWPGARPEGDALVTKTPGLALSILTADCTPVLFADEDAHIIGAAHAGWKGALAGVLEATAAAMRKLGARAIRAAIGPTIAQASYEVGPEFEARFLQVDSANARFFSPGAGDRRHFDLPAYCATRLAGIGVAVEDLALDTCAEAENFFSFRRATHAREPDYGRNCAVIALPTE